MEYSVLGQLRVVDDGRDVTPRGQRATDVLGLLLLRRGRAVDAQVVLDLVWGEAAPGLAPAVVHTVVARLRRALGDGQIETTGTGYRLRADAPVDAATFGDAVEAARRCPAAESAGRLREALALWRGTQAYEGVSGDLATAERQRLDALRTTTVEALAEALLSLPDHAGWREANALVEGLIAADPLRERAYELLMLGSYRVGHQADALATYTRLRSVLRDELGIDPGPGATELQCRILEQDPTLGGGPVTPALVARPTAAASALGSSAALQRLVVERTLVGRDAEQSLLAGFVADGTGACVLLGEPGIGKSALWESAAELAMGLGCQVLSSRPSEGETRFSFSVLADLLREVDLAGLDGLPGPQRDALEIALLRTPGSEVADPYAISVGLSTVLSLLAGHAPVVVAIDDLQWVDAESAVALTFAARRLDRRAVRFVLARRTTHERTSLERVFPAAVHLPIELGPLDLDETGRLLQQNGLTVPRRVTRLVFDQAAGNVLFTLELARVLRERGTPAIGESLGVPSDMADLLGLRIDELAPDLRRVLLAVALESHLSDDVLVSLTSEQVLEDAVTGRVVVVHPTSGRTRAWHPLLAAVARERSTPAQRRRMHWLLAELVPDPDSRARHLALGTEGRDAEMAATLSRAAAKAQARRAFETAAELSELALGLTPDDSAERPERVLAHARQLRVAGQSSELTAFLAPEVESLPVGARGRAWLMLVDGIIETVDHAELLVGNAVRDSGGDPSIRAEALSQQACFAIGMRVRGVAQALVWGEEAIALDPAFTDGRAWGQAVRGIEVEADDVIGRAWMNSPRIALAMQCSWRGEVHRAREILGQEMAAADREGRSLDFVMHQMHLGEVMVRAGELETAAAVLDLLGSSAESDSLESPDDERMNALMAALRGEAAEARRWAALAIDGAERVGATWSRLDAQRALGLAALFDGDLVEAADTCREVWDWCEREGIRDPGAFPVAADLVEALVGLDRLDEARDVTARLRELATEQAHPWGLATADRSEALIDLVRGTADPEAAAERISAAARELARLGLRTDEARSLLTLGTLLGRQARWTAMHDALEAAAARFDAVGARGWAAKARAELVGIG